MTDTIPSQPFPSQAVWTIDGGLVEHRDGQLPPATLVMPALDQVLSLTQVFLDRFGSESPSPGQALLVRGEHGSGKTHAIWYLMSKLADPDHRRQGPKKVTQLYAKAEAGDLVAVYRSLLEQLAPTTLRELAARFTAEIAAEVIVAGADGDQPKDLHERLREEPDLFREMLRVYYVDESEVLRRRDEEITRLTGEIPDFINAFTWIDSEIGELAHRWFIGSELSSAERRQLGVSGAIDSLEAVRAALRLLSALCSYSRRPLIVYVDQYEKLVIDDDGQLNRPLAGAIHTLAEVLPQEDAMLLLAGNDQAWTALPTDLKQRFGPRVVECRGLGLEEAEALVALYLHPRREAPPDPDIPPAELLPFTSQGLARLHLYSAGNVRRLLELCASAYEARAPGGVIDLETANRVAAEPGVSSVDVASTLETMTLVAEGCGYAVKRLSTAVGVALNLSSAGRERVRIVLGQAAHYDSEVIEAGRLVELVDTLRGADAGMRLLLVVLGYESAEVCEALARVGIEVLRLRPQTFAADFASALEGLAWGEREEALVGQDRLASELREVRITLETLQREREADARGLATQTLGLDVRYRDAHIAERWEQATREWVTERARLEGAIRDARSRRRELDLQELSDLREHAESARRTRQLWIGLVMFAALVALIFGAASAFGGEEVEVRSVVLLYVGGVTLATVVPLSLSSKLGLGGLLRRSPIDKELAMPVNSADDLWRLAKRASASPMPMSRYLRNENPQVRFVAAISASNGREVEMLADAMLGERCALVRKAYAKRVGKAPSLAMDLLQRSREWLDTPEAVYTLEGFLRLERPPLGLAEYVPYPLRLLIAIIGDTASASPAARMLRAAGVHEREVAALDRAIDAGLPLASRATLSELSTRSLRVVARASSPFDDGGLGTYDELAPIDEIDSGYLALSQLLYLSELGLLVD